jgi:hypothetical protein
MTTQSPKYQKVPQVYTTKKFNIQKAKPKKLINTQNKKTPKRK